MPDSSFRLVQLPNGIYSVQSLEFGETCHPRIGPEAEAEVLYIEQLNLPNRLAAHSGPFILWDVGLGAAANPLCILRRTQHIPAEIRLISFDNNLEMLRFSIEHSEPLQYLKGYEPFLEQLLHRGHTEFLNGAQKVHWELRQVDFPQWLSRSQPIPKPHLILFDPFSPAKNPGMWTLPLFTQLFRFLDRERPCLLPTYSRSTLLRVTLLLAGFFVGIGRATGEKEETTIAGNQPQLIPSPLPVEWLAKVRNSTSAEPLTEPVYRQSPLSLQNWEKLQKHPQFSPKTCNSALGII